MGIPERTQKKIEEILAMMTAGEPAREIAKQKFKGGIKDYLKFLEKHKEFFSEFESYFSIEYENKKNKNVSEPFKSQKNDVVNFSEYNLETIDKEQLKSLNPETLGQLLIMFAPDILDIVSKSKNIEKINKFIDENDNLLKLDDTLIVTEDILQPKKIVARTVKFSEDILREFEKVTEQYPHYTKQSLFNVAIKDFIQKYRKNKRKK